jgi:hypothetical protein
MGIESELSDYLEKCIKDGSNKSRDIEIIKFYYGLRESAWPTLEETAVRFNIGSRERIRQLLNAKFRNHVSENDIPALNDFIKILQSKEYWLLSDFEKEVVRSGLIDKETHIKGIFNLFEDVGLTCNFEIYSPELKRATRNSILSSKNSYLIQDVDIKSIEKLFKQAEGLPGRCGVANLNYIKQDLGVHYQLVASLIESSRASWVNIDGDNFWYVFENRDNTIVNYSEKVFSVIEHCDSSRLATVYRNALDGRTYQYSYPPTDVVKAYLESSVYFANTDHGLKFIGETTQLNDIERDLVLFLKYQDNLDFRQFFNYLEKKGYGRPHIIKTTNFSPLVFVDKSKGRGHHTYNLVGKKTSNAQLILSQYEKYLRRLRELLNIGTDEIREETARKEQYILQEWLFKDKLHECCAICRRDFSIKTLVTAHKKPRAECNDAERLDPYIVMPLCLMGCDYLYENMYIYIKDYKINRGIEFPDAKVEMSFIDNLIGKSIDPKWASGNQSYFRSPN